MSHRADRATAPKLTYPMAAHFTTLVSPETKGKSRIFALPLVTSRLAWHQMHLILVGYCCSTFWLPVPMSTAD